MMSSLKTMQDYLEEWIFQKTLMLEIIQLGQFQILQFIMQYSNSQNKSPLNFDFNNLVETKIINNKLIEKNDTCIICQECFEEEQTIMILQCDHFFHRDCLLMWFQYQNKCPLCKKIVH